MNLSKPILLCLGIALVGCNEDTDVAGGLNGSCPSKPAFVEGVQVHYTALDDLGGEFAKTISVQSVDAESVVLYVAQSDKTINLNKSCFGTDDPLTWDEELVLYSVDPLPDTEEERLYNDNDTVDCDSDTYVINSLTYDVTTCNLLKTTDTSALEVNIVTMDSEINTFGQGVVHYEGLRDGALRYRYTVTDISLP